MAKNRNLIFNYKQMQKRLLENIYIEFFPVYTNFINGEFVARWLYYTACYYKEDKYLNSLLFKSKPLLFKKSGKNTKKLLQDFNLFINNI